MNRALELLRSRRSAVYAAVAVVALALVVGAVVVQYTQHVEPCPLCILQRYAFTLLAVCAALAAVFRGRVSAACALLALLCAAAGAAISAWHVHLQLDPPAESVCGPSLQYMLNNMPLGRALPRIFVGFGDCTEIDWTFLHLTLPGWALVWMLLLGASLVYGLRRPS